MTREELLEITRKELLALIKDLADDLEAELNARYTPDILAYPTMQGRYERDMANIYKARELLR